MFISFFLDDNDDHRRTNQLFFNSIDYKEFKGMEVWAYQVYSTLIGNVVVDITEVINIKVLLINMWKNVEGERDWESYVLGVNMMNCRFLSKKESKYGELFFVLPIKEYMELCENYFLAPNCNIYHNPKYF